MHDFTCTVERCGFSSRGHETKKDMNARKAQHMAEHATGEPMPEIAEFMAGNKDVHATVEGDDE